MINLCLTDFFSEFPSGDFNKSFLKWCQKNIKNHWRSSEQPFIPLLWPLKPPKHSPKVSFILLIGDKHPSDSPKCSLVHSHKVLHSQRDLCRYTPYHTTSPSPLLMHNPGWFTIYLSCSRSSLNIWAVGPAHSLSTPPSLQLFPDPRNWVLKVFSLYVKCSSLDPPGVSSFYLVGLSLNATFLVFSHCPTIINCRARFFLLTRPATH